MVHMSDVYTHNKPFGTAWDTFTPFSLRISVQTRLSTFLFSDITDCNIDYDGNIGVEFISPAIVPLREARISTSKRGLIV